MRRQTEGMDGCEDCGVYYRDEIHVKMHLKRHCTKCFDKFSPKNVLQVYLNTWVRLKPKLRRTETCCGLQS